MAALPENSAPGFEAWVYHRMWNWSAWCWDGAWPHPLPVISCGSAERRYRPPVSRDDEERLPKRAIHVEHALMVDRIYQELPRVEQRIVQFEYPRRYEFDEFNFRGELIRNVRLQKGCRMLGIKQVYYQVALGSVLAQVQQVFLDKGIKG
ncbi:hypothetical protein KVP10_08480 [Candidimonas humi]|uniref:Uncharacterized protein n=1 Tax=Candidimonas humi TaxID=683355 RepID=A0ABV8NWN5_9BURK|nr:hypothetical protein [Candidimonas humi]MBV6304922.1 hypothetical protein [Candidimonas humi]